jgi:hypothetical protein
LRPILSLCTSSDLGCPSPHGLARSPSPTGSTSLATCARSPSPPDASAITDADYFQGTEEELMEYIQQLTQQKTIHVLPDEPGPSRSTSRGPKVVRVIQLENRSVLFDAWPPQIRTQPASTKRLRGSPDSSKQQPGEAKKVSYNTSISILYNPKRNTPK